MEDDQIQSASRLTEDMKMDVGVKEEDRAGPPGPSCLSMKSDWSKGEPLNFSEEPGPSAISFRAQSSVRSETTAPDPPRTLNEEDVGLQKVLDEHQISLRRRCKHVTEGSDETGSRTLLNRIYTELYITEGQSEEVNTQHEVRQLETASKKSLHETPIRCQDIFKALPEQHAAIRVVLTNGVAGVGKTFSVQKFTLDWAEGLENQDVSVVILFSFRELNLMSTSIMILLTVMQEPIESESK
ncbi:NACHT, LRR and PYD domains-containing protein 3-like [Kryptolebias marmoratus]|uniref:NACHT, LRR and PYD domains-containing protein 3-like n=1 Tax=Kryptolebias marmoratus TaxID=37003 RepID=UPI0018AC92D1|nr:NACHT, LRR and PYD domains-containing protein 3-like [Kryptolebias marmoratus]